jgi:hypothetical protein
MLFRLNHDSQVPQKHFIKSSSGLLRPEAAAVAGNAVLDDDLQANYNNKVAYIRETYFIAYYPRSESISDLEASTSLFLFFEYFKLGEKSFSDIITQLSRVTHHCCRFLMR